MPKLEIDYSNTIIYKITCNNPNINDTYVGHTTNFIQKKYAHKQMSCNAKNKIKLYETIRKYGGWDNWKMEIVNFFNCVNIYDAKLKEQEYVVMLNANLNSMESLTNPKKNDCNDSTNSLIESTESQMETIESTTVNEVMDSSYTSMNSTIKDFECKCGKKYKDRTGLWKHKKKCNIDVTKITNYYCICGKNYKNNNKLQNHYVECEMLKTTNIIPSDIIDNINSKNSLIEEKHNCSCGKKYKNRSGLWKHKKYCNEIIQQENQEKQDKENKEKNDNNSLIILELLKQNQEFQKLLMEQMEQNNKMIEIVKDNKCNTITNNTTNNNNSNNNFNLNMFLNEKCSNAMNIMDFVSSLNVQLDDLENTANVGYVNGISKIFLRNLNALDIYERPIHCSDLKRETIYIKDNGVWEKDEDKKKVKKVIQNISHKNLKQIKEWVQEYPESKDITTKIHDHYMKILNKCSGGLDDEENEKFYSKIIKNVTKEVYIDKNSA
jgi:hypothetical protein